MQTLTLKIPQMNCQHCISKITTFVYEVEGVQHLDFSLENKEVTISYTTPATRETIILAIEECGFEVS